MFYDFSYLKWARLVDHSKTRQICPDFKWSGIRGLVLEWTIQESDESGFRMVTVFSEVSLPSNFYGLLINCVFFFSVVMAVIPAVPFHQDVLHRDVILVLAV